MTQKKLIGKTLKNSKREKETNTLTTDKQTDILEYKHTRNNNNTPSLYINHTQNQMAQTSQAESSQNKTLTGTTYNSSQEEKQYSTKHNIKNKDDNFGQSNKPEDKSNHSDISTSSSSTK